MTDAQLIELATKARENAYTPYSKFKVGSAVLTKSGKVYTGCNVENASFGLSICAERVAIFSAVKDGETEFESIAVITESDIENGTPCGACRQVIWEFAPEMKIIIANTKGESTITNIKELLPKGFRL